VKDTATHPIVEHMLDDILDAAVSGAEIRISRECSATGDAVTLVEVWAETFNRCTPPHRGVVVGAQDPTMEGAVRILWHNRPRAARQEES
jgi:hypothetical protein